MVHLTADLAPGGILVECTECDTTLAAYGGTLVHHDDGSHTFTYADRTTVTETRKPLFLEDSFVTVPISESASRVILEFMRLHTAELDADLEPYGLTMNQIAQPTFERVVYADEAAG